MRPEVRKPSFSRASPTSSWIIPPVLKRVDSALRFFEEHLALRFVGVVVFFDCFRLAPPPRRGASSTSSGPGTRPREPLAELIQDRARCPVALELGQQLLLADREPDALQIASRRLRPRRERPPQKAHDLRPPPLP